MGLQVRSEGLERREDESGALEVEVHVRDDRYEFMLTTAQPWDAWTVVRWVPEEPI